MRPPHRNTKLAHDAGTIVRRATVAHEIASLVRYAGKSVREAADIVVHEQLQRMGGEGGVIVVGRDGTLALPFNSRGMLRGSIDAQGRMTTGIL